MQGLDTILSGYLTEEEWERVQEYQAFFEQNDSERGTGYYEVSLHDFDDEEKSGLKLRAFSDGMDFGFYGPEGWERARSVDVETPENVFIGSMIPYYVDDTYSSVTMKTVKEAFHPDDHELFEEVIRSRQSD